MATSKLMETKDGKRFYRIQVSRGRGKSPAESRWYIPDGWSAKAIERGLRQAERELQNKIDSGEYKSRSELKAEAEAAAAEAEKIKTVKQFGEQVFMPAKTMNVSEGTRYYYQNALTNHIYPALGNKKVTEVSAADASALVLAKQTSGLSWSSCMAVYVTLSQLFGMVYQTDVVERNIMDKVQRPKQSKEEKNADVQFYSAKEVQNIYDALTDESIKWQVFVHLAVDTGCRKGELCALKWSALDFQSNTILISENLCYNPDAGIYTGATKSGKKRTVYFGSDTAALLRKLRDSQDEVIEKRKKRMIKEGKPLDFSKLMPTEFLFPDKADNSKAMHPQSPDRFFQKFGKKHGIEDFHPHKLRHTFASLAITSGADVVSVSEILGHAETSTTLNMYAHADAESRRRAAAILQNAIKQA